MQGSNAKICMLFRWECMLFRWKCILDGNQADLPTIFDVDIKREWEVEVRPYTFWNTWGISIDTYRYVLMSQVRKNENLHIFYVKLVTID